MLCDKIVLDIIIIITTISIVRIQSSAHLTNIKHGVSSPIDQPSTGRGKRELPPPSIKKYGLSCTADEQCDFENAYCNESDKICLCRPGNYATDRIDRCGTGANIGEACSFDEQCEYLTLNSFCKEAACVCRGNGKPEKQNDGSTKCIGKKFGDKCGSNDECGFKWSICEPHKNSCQCHPEYYITNHIDKCGKPATIDEDCYFNEQCEREVFNTVCSDSKCSCRYEAKPRRQPDNTIKCVADDEDKKSYTDPAMLLVLGGMCLMFIIICVVLHLFSKARWRENRTIFNTPNPRLMNVSLLKEKQKCERRGSKGSIKVPSRDPSLASLRQHSPSTESKATSRRESRVAANGSARSPLNKVPPVSFDMTTASSFNKDVGSTV